MSKLKVTRKVLPGQPGAIRETRVYKESLLAVRYKKDDEGRYVKTAEIILSEKRA